MNSGEGQMSRRDFLKLALAGGALSGVFVASKFSDVAQGVDFEIAKTILSEKSLSILPEIENYRRKLKLDKFPAELVSGINQNIKWVKEPPILEIGQSENMPQYSEVVSQITELAFGKNKSRLIKAVRFDSKYPDNLFFDVTNREALVGTNINKPINEFIDSMIHEIVGHPADPAGFVDFKKSLYPPDMLVSVEHGKWKALSQAFLVEGQFFNHPGDAMLPLVAKKIGKIVGQHLSMENEFLPIFTGFGDKHAESIVQDIAKDFSTTLSKLNYNKAVCIRLGKRLIDAYLKNEIEFSGNLKTSYEEGMEYSLREIFAEMVRIVVVHNNQDYLGKNTEINDGIEEVLRSINPELISLEAIKKTLYNKVGYEEVDLSKEEVSNVIENKYYETAENLSKERAPKSKVEDLIGLSSTPEEIFLSLHQYIVQRYPSLAISTNQEFNLDFDPNLDLWEIEWIEWAIDSNFVNSVVTKSIDQKARLELDKRIKVLKGFINSQAF